MEQEENGLQENQVDSSQESSRTRVGFPEATRKSGGSKLKKIIVILLIIAVLGAGGWFLFGRTTGEDETEEVSPTTFSQPTSAPSPTTSQVDKKEVKIQVLNGTGIAGGAGALKTELEKLGYSEIEAGNASTQDFVKTQVSLSSSVPQSVKDEITDKLEAMYQSVTSDSGSTGSFDIKITTGYPKGHTATPTKKPTTAISPTKAPAGTTGTVTPTGTSTSITPTKTPTVTPT